MKPVATMILLLLLTVAGCGGSDKKSSDRGSNVPIPTPTEESCRAQGLAFDATGQKCIPPTAEQCQQWNMKLDDTQDKCIAKDVQPSPPPAAGDPDVCAQGEISGQTFTIDKADDLASLADFDVVDTIRISPDVPNVALPRLKCLTGSISSISPTVLGGLETLSGDELVQAKTIHIDTHQRKTISLKKLVTVESLSVLGFYADSSSSIHLDALTHVAGKMSMHWVKNVTLPPQLQVGGNLFLAFGDSNAIVSKLAKMGGHITVIKSFNETIQNDQLEEIGGDVVIHGNEALFKVAFTKLRRIKGSVILGKSIPYSFSELLCGSGECGNEDFRDLSLPSLESIDGDVVIMHNGGIGNCLLIKSFKDIEAKGLIRGKLSILPAVASDCAGL